MPGIQNNGFNPNFIVNVNKRAKTQNTDLQKTEDKLTKNPESDVKEKTQFSANDVLSFMANSSVYNAIASTKQINPAKYISEAQKSEISESMKSFESKFEEHFNSIITDWRIPYIYYSFF